MANVGGWRHARGLGPWGRATGAALASPFGVGNARIWRPPAASTARRDTETVPLGCFRVAALRAVGGWREDLLANEDFELNHRLRTAGHRVVFDPAIWSIYRPRESLAAVSRQYRNYGRWKAVVLTGAPASLRPRQLAPPLLVATLAAAVTPSPAARPSRLALCAYGIALGVEAARSGGGWRTGPVLATMHLAWAFGLLEGLVRGGQRGS